MFMLRINCKNESVESRHATDAKMGQATDHIGTDSGMTALAFDQATSGKTYQQA